MEADPAVLNLSPFETFFQEKRPFFLEGKRILDFALAESEGSFDIEVGAADTSFGEGFGSGDVLYYSRRIGARPSLFPELSEGEFTGSPPAATTILAAAKVSGASTGNTGCNASGGCHALKRTPATISPRRPVGLEIGLEGSVVVVGPSGTSQKPPAAATWGSAITSSIDWTGAHQRSSSASKI